MTSKHTNKVEQEESASETESDAGTFACCLCDGEIFHQKSELTEHLLTHGEGAKKKAAEKDGQSEGETKPFICQICSKAFTWLAYLKQHLLYRHSKRPAPKQLGRVRKQASQQVNQTKDKKKSGTEPCEFCGKTFSRREDLLPHHRRAHTWKLKACEQCGQKFAPDWLERHVQRAHCGDAGPPYVCSTCDKEFARKSSLVAHRQTHAQEEVEKEDLVCEDCDMEFATEQALDNHKWCHTVARPFTCDSCGKGFTAEGHLKRHAKTHDARIGQPAEATKKPFTCEKCDRSFVQKSHLVMHIRFNHNN